MKKIGTGFIFLFVMCVALSTTAFAKQPYSSYWFPEQLLQWSPASDPDAVFNRSTIPLQDRFVTDGVNAHATKAPKLWLYQH